MPTLGVSVAVLQDGQILLTQREDVEVWCLPGGAIEDGESLARAAVRETYEETGLHVELTGLVGIYSKPNWNSGGQHVVVFTAQPIGGSLSPAPDEVLEASYFEPGRLPAPILWWHRQPIQDALAGIGGSVAWSQNARWPSHLAHMTRQELYALRDRSGLSRRQFYLEHFEPPDMDMDDATLEVGGRRKERYMDPQASDFAANIERFTGFADLYENYRPHPPPVLGEMLPRLAQAEPPQLVVDLGAGTGLSTRFWADRAARVIGVEPVAGMRQEAARQTSAANVAYQEGFSHQTGQPDGCADIVTCSQSLHWMDPQPTFAEVARILRPGGVFAAYDCDWPPTTSDWEADALFTRVMDHVRTLEREHRATDGLQRWSKEEHLARMQASGRFRYTKEIVVHHVDAGNAERLVGLARSQGSVAGLLKRGLGEDEIGLVELQSVAERALGDAPRPWYWSYRVRIGIV